MDIKITQRKTEDGLQTDISIDKLPPDMVVTYTENQGTDAPPKIRKKSKTGPFMKLLGVICLIIFAAAILNSCLFK